MGLTYYRDDQVEGNVYAYGSGKRVCRKCAVARASATYQRRKTARALLEVEE